MGKKSSSSTPQIPDGMVEAIQKQADVAARQEEWYENTMYPWLVESTAENTAIQKQLADASIADAEWWRDWTVEQTEQTNAIRDSYYEHWRDNYLPIENQLIEDAQNYNSDAYAEQQAQAALGDVASSYANQRQQTTLNMSKYGIDPTSGQYMGQMNALGVNQAAASAAAQNAARQAAVELGWNKNLQLANLGVNYANITNSATSAAAQTASTGSSATTNASNSASNYSNNAQNSVNQLAQTGLQSYQSLTNAWGQMASSYNQMYQSQLSAWNAQQQASASSSAGIGSMVGSIATTAAIAM